MPRMELYKIIQLQQVASNAILGMQNTKDIKVLNNSIDGTDNQNGIYFMYQDEKVQAISKYHCKFSEKCC